MATHIPGPWQWVRVDANVFLQGNRESDNCILALRDDWASWRPFPDCPNARLLCAAPDLLRAAQVALLILERDGIAPLRGLAFTDDETELIRAAVAKATTS